MARYIIKVTDSATDYGHEHEETNKQRALEVAREHRGGLYQRSGGTVKVCDMQEQMVIWEWTEGAEGGYFQATPAHPYTDKTLGVELTA